MRRRITLLSNSPLRGPQRFDGSSNAIHSGIRTRHEALNRLTPDNLHALHSAPPNVFLFEAVLNSAAQFAGGVILAARHGAKLQP
jgi:hypothetical protein